MALKANRGRLHTSVNRVFGGNSVAGIYGLGVTANPHTFVRGSGVFRNFDAGEHSASGVTIKSGRPNGARHPIAWLMPRNAGGLSSHSECQGVANATLSLADGRNIAATSAGVATASATLQLVVSLTATTAGVATVSGNVVASLAIAGATSAAATCSATVGALAWAVGLAEGSSTASLVRYATGALAGSVTPFTELSPQSLASAVIAAAQLDPIYADVRKINGSDVTGSGTELDKWRGV